MLILEHAFLMYVSKDYEGSVGVVAVLVALRLVPQSQSQLRHCHARLGARHHRRCHHHQALASIVDYTG